MSWFPSESSFVALLAAILSAPLAAFLTIRGHRARWKEEAERASDDKQQAGAAAQNAAWALLVTQTREYASDLDKRLRQSIADCDRQLGELRKEMLAKDEDCRQRLAALEHRLIAPRDVG